MVRESMHTEPSNSNLWDAGVIQIKPDSKRNIVHLCIHFTSIHLSERETHELIYKLSSAGEKTWGSTWATSLYHSLSAVLKRVFT
jgi:hypothetical protein